jgi:hypothetical protein
MHLRTGLPPPSPISRTTLPPLRVVRPSHVVHVYYGFGDTSGKQFGATISADYNCRGCLSRPTKGKRGIRFRVGLWLAKEEDESSNYKELCNLVETVAGEARAGRLYAQLRRAPNVLLLPPHPPLLLS